MIVGGAGRTRVKICGLRDPAAVRVAVEAGADAIGFVVADGSPRQLPVMAVADLVTGVPLGVTPVVVSRSQPDHESFGVPGIVAQLHGDEAEADCRAARDATGRRIIRGFAFSPAAVRRWDACDDVGLLLVDAPAPGSGQSFDHGELAAMRSEIRTPIALAGGLDPDTVGGAIEAVRPYMVDVSSGVESTRGVKDHGRIAAFLAAVQAADAAS